MDKNGGILVEVGQEELIIRGGLHLHPTPYLLLAKPESHL